MSQITDISRSRDNFLPELLTVWEDSVRSSHEFLSEQDIETAGCLKCCFLLPRGGDRDTGKG